MTHKEHWDAMTPRERDAWVAEHVMGWRDVDDGKFMAKWKGYDEDTGKVLWDQTDHSGIPSEGGCRDFLPNCSTDASADYLVLKKVRETWGNDKKIKFEMNLESQFHRTGCCQAMNYQSGDYSYAAYLTLTQGTNV